MARLPRLVLPGLPYHVTQRGNRRQQVFFEDGDYELYRDLLADAARRAGAAVWAYCLMLNHVHVIVVPSDEDGLRATFAEAHRRVGVDVGGASPQRVGALAPGHALRRDPTMCVVPCLSVASDAVVLAGSLRPYWPI